MNHESSNPRASISCSGGVVSNSVAQENLLLKPVCLEGIVFDWKTETWIGRHEAICRAVAEGDPEVIFIGDSITHHWERDGIDSWTANFAKFRPVNMGFGGDRIQHVLWRLQHGELENISPRLAVLLIGTNNSADNTAADIAEGIGALCHLIREKLPATKILLLAIFPRDTPGAPRRLVNEEVNRMICKLDDGEHVHFRDLGGFLVDENGSINTELMEDLLHPNASGYAAWAEILNPVVAELLEG